MQGFTETNRGINVSTDMENRVRQGDLYDFYGELLNPHQRGIYEDYVLNDLSLAEIAEEVGTSRQAVHDIIRRCTKTLESYEEKLGLLKRFMLVKNRIAQIRSAAAGGTDSTQTVQQIAQIAEQIWEDLN